MQIKELIPTIVILFNAVSLPLAASLGCPSVPAVKDFSLKDFVGQWYQQASKDTLLFQGPGSCAKAEYTLDEKTNTVAVHNSQKGIFGEQNVDGTAVLADPNSKEGKLTVTLNTLGGKQTADLLVLSTDNKNYAILYSCKSLVFPLTSAWILTRKQKLEGDEKIAIDKKIDEAFTEINKNKDTPKRADFTPTSQDNC